LYTEGKISEFFCSDNFCIINFSWFIQITREIYTLKLKNLIWLKIIVNFIHWIDIKIELTKDVYIYNAHMSETIEKWNEITKRWASELPQRTIVRLAVFHVLLVKFTLLNFRKNNFFLSFYVSVENCISFLGQILRRTKAHVTVSLFHLPFPFPKYPNKRERAEHGEIEMKFLLSTFSTHIFARNYFCCVPAEIHDD
jgi:hypothetical protein